MARRKTILKVAEPKSEWCVNEADIEKYSKAVVAKALSPSRLMEYVTDYVQPLFIADEPEELQALRTAIDSRYPEFQKRYKAGDDSDELEKDLQFIEEEMLYQVGLEVGRRVSRD